ncbi:MAG: helix-turn-helix domain-containing protein, partial [Oleiphilaceae bacterium]|nr:helix-turn-helix domain-containing protein [Oleiphilaceae bacterium]
MNERSFYICYHSVFKSLPFSLSMPASFNYQEFLNLCPLDDQRIIQQLISRHFGDLSDKRRQKAEENLQAIITATFELAASIGFAKMSMRDLHKACGMSLGGLYNYFESKEALALMITEALHLIAFEWLPSLTDATQPREKQLERLIRGHIYLSEML